MAVAVTPAVFYTLFLTGLIISISFAAVSIYMIKVNHDLLKEMPETDPRHHSVKTARNVGIAFLIISLLAVGLMAFVYLGGHERLAQTRAFQRVRQFLTPATFGSEPTPVSF